VSKGLQGVTGIENLDLKNKRVFIRCDFNVPMENGNITDDTRITATWPTIDYALKQGADVILGSHLGRPKKSEDHKKFSLEPVAEYLRDKYGHEIILVDDPESDAPKALIAGLKKNQIIMLENLRFSAGEEKNSHEFAAQLSSYIDVYINDAFGASHRAHASVSELPRLMPIRGAGFLIQKELAMLDKLLESPRLPYWVIMGGAKVSDKIGVIEKLIDKVDGFIIGGAMAYTFLKAMGVEVGHSLVEREKIEFTGELIKRVKARGKKILLPIDHRVSQSIKSSEVITTPNEKIPDGFLGLDIGPQTEKLFCTELLSAKTVFWNGPMGVFENPKMCQGTFAIAKALSGLEADTIVGGGDTASAAKASGFADMLTHISTGGGASLEYLQGDPLPGIDSLRKGKRGE